jgi:hypothetical protein
VSTRADDEYVVDFPTLWVVPDWIEAHVPHVGSPTGLQPYSMYDWQLWCTANHYRVRPTATRGQLAAAFHYRRSQVVAPQKVGKGPWSASITLAEALGPVVFDGWAGKDDGYACADHGCGCGWEYAYEPGDPMGVPWQIPLLQLTARSVDQVDNVYGPLKTMIRNGPLSDLAVVGEEFTRLPNDGRIDVVTSAAQSRLGNPIIFAMQDESGTYTRQNKMIATAETQRRGAAGMGGRTMETTNAWNPAQQSYAQRTAESKRPDIFRFHRVPPKGLSYKNKRERRRIHAFVYAGSTHVDLDTIEAEAAELLEHDPSQAERFFGNRVVGETDSFFDGDAWDASALLQTVAPGTLVTIGFDGSEAEARGHPDETWIRVCRLSDLYLFTPTFPNGEKMRWKHPDDPELAKTWRVPRGEVMAAFRLLFSRFRVVRAYMDPPRWQSEIDALQQEFGDQVVIPWETYRTKQMAAALERFDTDIRHGEVIHDGDPEVAQQIRNARTSERMGGHKLIVKPSQDEKIDADMSTALAYEAAYDAIADGALTPPPSRAYVAS